MGNHAVQICQNKRFESSFKRKNRNNAVKDIINIDETKLFIKESSDRLIYTIKKTNVIF